MIFNTKSRVIQEQEATYHFEKFVDVFKTN